MCGSFPESEWRRVEVEDVHLETQGDSRSSGDEGRRRLRPSPGGCERVGPDNLLLLLHKHQLHKVAARISVCLTDVSQWTSAHHLKINLDKTELFVKRQKKLNKMLKQKNDTKETRSGQSDPF
ncbi:unnamed protein product [Pleuronectes platessa]|uniref:Uncharacterized protein n=1 Tax=Pleuronectes platessa TaxID=8262 RepID=A0A9N7U7H0_PLEPL|nr:unnamed protein product [Pleuronectes platessa]